MKATFNPLLWNLFTSQFSQYFRKTLTWITIQVIVGVFPITNKVQNLLEDYVWRIFVCMHLKKQSKQMSHVNKPPWVYLISVLQLKLHNVTIIFSWRYQVDSQQESHTDFSKTRHKTSTQDIFSPNPLKIPFPLVPTFSRDMTSSTEWKVLKEIVWSWWKYGLNKKWILLDFEILAAVPDSSVVSKLSKLHFLGTSFPLVNVAPSS